MLDFDSLCETIDCLFSLPHSIILLRGDLASGKTTLVQQFAQKAESQDLVVSPTFGIQNIYRCPMGEIFHYDLYRKTLQECFELGLLEMLDADGRHFVEWGGEDLEKFLKQSGFSVLIVTITKKGAMRHYRIFD